MNPDQKASAELAKAAIWSEDSLGYARERGQRKLVWLLEAVKADVEFEGSLRSLPSRAIPASPEPATQGRGQQAAHYVAQGATRRLAP